MRVRTLVAVLGLLIQVGCTGENEEADSDLGSGDTGTEEMADSDASTHADGSSDTGDMGTEDDTSSVDATDPDLADSAAADLDAPAGDADQSMDVEPDVPMPSGVKASTFGFDAENATTAFRAAIESAEPEIIIDGDLGTTWYVDPSSFFDLADKTIWIEEGRDGAGARRKLR